MIESVGHINIQKNKELGLLNKGLGQSPLENQHFV